MNCGFVITFVCAATMALFSVGGGVRPSAEEYARDRGSAVPMTPGERRKYHLSLVALAMVWLAVVVTFSLWGLAAPR